MPQKKKERKGMKCMRKVIERGREAGLIVSAEKTMCMLLKGIISERRAPSVTVDYA